MEHLNKTSLRLITFCIWIFFVLFGAGTFGLIIAIGFYWLANKAQKEYGLKKDSESQKQKEETQILIEKIKEEKRLEPINTSLFLESNENAFYKESSTLMESRSIRKSTGSGVGFRVMKGVYVGGYKGQSESNQELRSIESGDLIVTNKKLVFRGTMENRVIPLSKIIEVKMHADAIEIATTGKQKSSIFTVSNPYTWKLMMFVLSKVENPLDFSDIKNIDISI